MYEGYRLLINQASTSGSCRKVYKGVFTRPDKSMTCVLSDNHNGFFCIQWRKKGLANFYIYKRFNVILLYHCYRPAGSTQHGQTQNAT